MRVSFVCTSRCLYLCLVIVGGRLTCPGDDPTSGESRTLSVGATEARSGLRLASGTSWQVDGLVPRVKLAMSTTGLALEDPPPVSSFLKCPHFSKKKFWKDRT